MRIGIITLHRIINPGSALQAYATQKYIQSTFDCKCEIIDYVFPNNGYKPKQSLYKEIRSLVRQLRDLLFRNKLREKSMYEKFYKDYFIMSRRRYYNDEDLYQNPPSYDLILTGSDQVWNPKTLYGCPIMYGAFVPNGKKISYGASFSVSQLDEDEYIHSEKLLADYSFIGVRETSSLKILRTMKLPLSPIVSCTCDPTLLLAKDEYHIIAERSVRKVKKDFVFAYFLNYAFNPEPAFSRVLVAIEKKYDYNIVFKGCDHYQYKGKMKFEQNYGPSEFLWLIENAKIVITSSFHGLMFSLIFRKPFIVVCPENCEKDSRLTDVLRTLNLENRSLSANSDVNDIEFYFSSPYSEQTESLLADYIEESKRFLHMSIKTNNIGINKN